MADVFKNTCDTSCGCLIKRIMRRQFFIDKKFQIAMAANMALVSLICMLLTAMATSWFYVYFLNDRLWAEADTVFWAKTATIGAFMLAAVMIWTVVRTHQIAGPVCRIRRVLQEAARGKFPSQPVRFRQGDAFQELADDVNRCLEIMQHDYTRRD